MTTKTLTLKARIVPPSPVGEWTSTEAAEMLGITPPTLRDWVKRGLPQRGSLARPTYVPSEALTWALCYHHRVRLHGRCARLTMAEAWRWQRESEAEESPALWLRVPLAWDHPARAELLERAAAGIAPATDEVQ